MHRIKYTYIAPTWIETHPFHKWRIIEMHPFPNGESKRNGFTTNVHIPSYNPTDSNAHGDIYNTFIALPV